MTCSEVRCNTWNLGTVSIWRWYITSIGIPIIKIISWPSYLYYGSLHTGRDGLDIETGNIWNLLFPDEVRNFEILNRKSEYNPDETITCRAEGNPKPTVTWYDANGTPVIGTATSISEFTVNTILTIDAGMEGNHSYTCNASNSINNRDTVVSATIDFTVISKYVWDCDYELTLEVGGCELIQFNAVNIVIADALAPCVASTSATMILTM